MEELLQEFIASCVRGRLVENTLLHCDQSVSQYSISLRTYHHLTSLGEMSLISVDLNVVY